MKRLICFLFALVLAMICWNIDSSFYIKSANAVAFSKKPIIIVDAGHGDFDGGAVKGDIIEKDINLEFAKSLEIMLKAFGYKVIMTRTTDTGTEDSGLSSIHSKKVSDIKNRLNLIENTDSLCFVSLHQNMFSQSKYKGTQVFYSKNNANSSVYGECIQSAVKTLLQNENNRLIKPCTKDIYLMYHTTKPAVLIECGFMSNEQELENLLCEEYRNKLNFCILIGILNGRNSVKNG